MSDAFWAIGSTFQLGDGATPEAFVSLAEVTKLSPPSWKRDSIDVSNMSSPSGYREFLAGWRDGGEVKIEANWLPLNPTQDSTTGLLASFEDNVNHNFRLVLPDDLATISFRGHVTAYEPDLDLEKQGLLSVTIKVTGRPTLS